MLKTSCKPREYWFSVTLHKEDRVCDKVSTNISLFAKLLKYKKNLTRLTLKGVVYFDNLCYVHFVDFNSFPPNLLLD